MLSLVAEQAHDVRLNPYQSCARGLEMPSVASLTSLANCSMDDLQIA